MIKLKIDKKATFLPLAKSKGSTSERLSKAREANVQFLKNLKYDFVEREVKPAVFKRTLKGLVGKIGIKIEPVETPQEAYMHLHLDSRKTSKGYILGLPQGYWSNKIKQSHMPICLKQTQKIFNNIYNPKFLKREFAILNKSKDLESIKNFKERNIDGTSILKEKDLNEFLENKPVDEQINVLQFMRYNVLAEQNGKIAEKQVDNELKKSENIRSFGKNYDLSEFKYDDKMQILNKKLATIIGDERKKFQS